MRWGSCAGLCLTGGRVGAATYAISRWRAERNRILEMPEAKDLDWPRLENRSQVNVLGNLLPVAASIGFLLAWVVILINLRTA